PTFLDRLARNFRCKRTTCNPLPDHEAAAGLLPALPARAAVGLGVLPDDLAGHGAAPGARAQLDPLRPELLFVQGRDLVDRLLGEVGDALHELPPVAAPVLDL